MSLMYSLTCPINFPAKRTLTNSFISFFHRNTPVVSPLHQKVSFTSYSGASDLDDEPRIEQEAFSGGRQITNYTGVRLEERVEDVGKIRLDTWISTRINGISRARVQSSIRSGLVSVNHRVIVKTSHMIRHGDKVECTISELHTWLFIQHLETLVEH